MEKFFSISQTAKLANMTTETLRHYDRIGLVKPHEIDKMTRYRYYTTDEIVKLNTINALRSMKLPLNEIKSILELNDISKIINFLKQAETNLEDNIAELLNAKARIQRAKQFYESKASNSIKKENFILQDLPERVILLAKDLDTPTVSNLWNYHRHFYSQLNDSQKDSFTFEDLAGIYETNGQRHLFAVCTRYTKADGLIALPKGKYLCTECDENNHNEILDKLVNIAQNDYSTTPNFIVHIIILTGILQWKYQLQILIK